MDSDRHARVKGLFLKALEVRAADRHRMLSEVCAGDTALREEVEMLLACATEIQASSSTGPTDVSSNPTHKAHASQNSQATVGPRKCPKCQVTFQTGVYFCHNDGEPLVANPEALVGTIFDEIYEIEAMLGEGGMGTVYRARHQLLRDVVALKMLRGDERENLRWRRRFVREGQAARKFRHPNSVTVYDLRTSRDGTIYLVLEFVAGVTLRSAFRERRRYDCLEALRILEPLAGVLDTAHKAGVVHRDLKPENVMLTGEGPEVKLLDLGIAGFLGADASNGETAKLTQAGTVVGTPRYMSPEQWGERPRDGIAGVDGRADVYSMGIMAFELVTGRGPFRGTDANQLRQLHVSEPPADPRMYNGDIPEGFALAILVAISKDRADRYDTAGEFVRALALGLGRSGSSGSGPLTSRSDSGSSSASTPRYDGQTITDVVATVTDVGPGATVEDPPTNLPQSLTSFVGRHAEVEAVVEALRKNRLVTLVGPGGIGKTRLAVQAGREAFDAFPDGVWLVDLSALTTEALVVPSIGRVLEVTQRTGDDLEDAIVETIGARRLLLVLDNCEHVRNAVRSLLDEILRQCPYVHVLATSREALGLVAEHARDVPALATPPRDLAETDLLEACQSSEAVLLFVDRARAVRSDFRLTEQNVSPVVGICRRLDGIPLAIELAAARTVVMSPAQLLARLEKSLDLLASRQAGIPDRHRTLRASIEWSYQLLPIPLREFFSRLSVFRGGWTLEAAESVLSGAAAIDGVDTVDALEQLASSSLVVADEHFDEIRFRMLETIREFAVSLVPAEPGSSLRAAHAEYFRSFVELADEQLAGHDQHVWLAKVAADLDNVRAAIEWSKSSGNVDLGLKVAASMGRFWLVRGFVAEGIAALRDALSRAPSGLAGDRAKALNWAGNLAIMAGDVEGGRAWHEESLRIRRETGDLPGIAASLHNLGGIAADQGDFALADRLFEECTAIATEIGDDLRLGMALVNRGRAANERGAYSQAFDLLEHGIELLEQCGHTYAVCVGLLCIADAQMCSGDIDRAEVSFNRCFALASEMGERMASGFCLCGLGSIARYRGTLGPARENCDRAVAIARELGAEDLRATGLAILGEVAMLEGKLDDANRLMRQALRIRSGRNLRSGIALSLEGLAHVSLAAGRHERAARFLGAAAALRSQIGVPVPAIDLAAIKDATSRIRVALGDEAFVSAHTTGAALPLNDLRADIID